MTSKEINYSNGADLGDGISGFYYDSQLNLETMSASLHPNTILDENKNWKPIPDKEREPEENNIGHLFSGVTKEGKRTTASGKDPYPYRERPICRAILNDEFQVSIANNFTGFGEDFLGRAWSELKPFAPYVGDIAGFLGNIANQTEEFFNGKNLSPDASDMKSKFVNFLRRGKKAFGKAEDYLNRSLVVQGSRFSYYNGTGINFDNLTMKFTIFSGFQTVDRYDTTDHSKVNKVIIYNSVYRQVAEILPYVIGEFVPVTDITKDVGSSENTQKFVSEFASWQLPPGGYKPDYMDVDVVHPGTLKLRMGPYFSLENLVIKSAQFTYSKAMSKNPTYGGDKRLSDDTDNYLVPLSCEVLLNLGPITNYSRQSLERYMGGISSRGTMKALVERMEQNLENIKKKTDDVSKISKI